MAEKIYKEQVIEMVAERMGCSKTSAASALSAVLVSLEDTLRQNDRVILTGFGTFEVRPTAARKVRLINGDRAGELVDIAPSHRVAFVPGKPLVEKVRGARG
ncbi:MAG: HU family DNA-binding protein [Chloroflexi bacterium]|nr:HU family DNA-binding protein [Chloroflexota bacterium]